MTCWIFIVESYHPYIRSCEVNAMTIPLLLHPTILLFPG